MKKVLPFIISSILISLSFDFPDSLSFLTFVFLVPIIFYTKNTKNNHVTKADIFGMFLFGFIFAFLSSLWITSAYPLDWLGITDEVFSLLTITLVILLFSIIFAVPISLWIIFIYFFKKTNILLFSLIGASSWVLLEYLRSFLIILSTYGEETLMGPHYTLHSLGYTVFSIPIIKELIPMGGIYLASFFIILINYFLYAVLFEIKKEKKSLLILFAVITIPIILGFLIMKKVRAENSISETISPIIITTYLPSASNKYIEKYKKDVADDILRKITNETDNSIIIFPENINPTETKLEAKNNLVIGSFKNKLSYNKFFWNTKSNDVSYYEKQLLMPIGEYDISILKYGIKLIGHEKWSDIYNKYKRVSKSKDSSGFTFKYQDYLISGSICSENISPYIHKESVLNGSNLLINTLSHAPFHNSNLLSKQTVAINSTRALENGRYFITSSNYDRSFVVTDEGVLIGISPIKKELFSSFKIGVELKNYLTPYIKYGDYIIYISGIFLIIIILMKRKNN